MRLVRKEVFHATTLPDLHLELRTRTATLRPLIDHRHHRALCRAEVLIPVALAILLSFVLTPALLFLRRLKVPQVIGVAIVVAFAFAVIFALGWLMSQQATQLAEAIPRSRRPRRQDRGFA